MQMLCQEGKLKKNALKASPSCTPGCVSALAFRSLTYGKNAAPRFWMYKHWRYLPGNRDRPYPFYANFYRPFEDLLERDRARSLTEGNEENEA